MQGARAMFAGSVSDKDWAIVDAVATVASELETTSSTVALAWVQQRPGISATLIGARTLDQLEANFKSIAFKLPVSAIARLDAISKPTLNFPDDFIERTALSVSQAGTTVNGLASQATPMTPASDAERH